MRGAANGSTGNAAMAAEVVTAAATAAAAAAAAAAARVYISLRPLKRKPCSSE